MVEHFWENRRVGAVLFGAPTRPLLAKTLAGLIEAQLRARPEVRNPTLLAAQVAGGQLGLLSTWLAGHTPATPEAVVEMLYAAAQAVQPA